MSVMRKNPTPEEIRAACLEIQELGFVSKINGRLKRHMPWTNAERRRRAGEPDEPVEFQSYILDKILEAKP